MKLVVEILSLNDRDPMIAMIAMIEMYVDVDGVLANLTGSLCSIFQVAPPQGDFSYRTWVWEQTTLTEAQFEEGIERHPDIWTQLSPSPVLPRLVQLLDLRAPGWQILSSALPQAACWAGKMTWVKQHLSLAMVRRMVLVYGNKARFAHSGSYLVDDDCDNCREWEKAGGRAFRWLDYTVGPKFEDLMTVQLEQLDQFLKEAYCHITVGL